MLLQSHAGEIHLLPALPKAWPRGSFTGLRARGGVEVDAEWDEGRLKSATLRASRGGTFRLRIQERDAVDLPLRAGDAYTLGAEG
jgi:alpha-L-fucosidase 2